MNKNKFAIVGGNSLLGKDLREVFEALPSAVDLKLIGAEENEALGLTEAAGEPVVVSPLDEENLTTSAVVLLAGSPESSLRAWEMLALRKKRPFVVDLTGALASVPGAQLRAPSVEAPAFKVKASAVQVIAHPASIALAILFRRLLSVGDLTNAIVHVFIPASEQGNRGLDELHQQTVSLFSFQNMPKVVFDDQLAFNMLSVWGEEATAGKLSDIETRLQTELAEILPPTKDIGISVRVVQAPVFHSLSFSVWIPLKGIVSETDLTAALRGDLVDIWNVSNGAPNNVSAVGDAGISLGDIRPDAANPGAYWLWMVADNLRLRATNAIGAARIWLS